CVELRLSLPQVIAPFLDALQCRAMAPALFSRFLGRFSPALLGSELHGTRNRACGLHGTKWLECQLARAAFFGLHAAFRYSPNSAAMNGSRRISIFSGARRVSDTSSTPRS